MCIAKTPGCTATRTKNECLKVNTVVYTGYFWDLYVEGYSGIILCLCDFWQLCASKKDGNRVKQTNLCGPGSNCSVYTGHFWLFNVRGRCRVIRCISDFRQLCISKMAGHRAKRCSTWDSGIPIRHIWLWWCTCTCSTQGYFGVILWICLKMAWGRATKQSVVSNRTPILIQEDYHGLYRVPLCLECEYNYGYICFSDCLVISVTLGISCVLLGKWLSRGQRLMGLLFTAAAAAAVVVVVAAVAAVAK